MKEEILNILNNVRYWETCPDNYKKVIEQFLFEEKHNECTHKNIFFKHIRCSLCDDCRNRCIE
ncbi:hypothetical protein [Flavobacterium sp.]|jgi:hypothetical protein|uniref:hypothetical protein n=1 Tax=Flavobacterium sp. TaxID=239 RepID=UPI0037BE3A45